MSDDQPSPASMCAEIERLTAELHAAQAVIAEDDATARLFLDGSALSAARLTAAREARRPHVAAYLARVACSAHRCPRPADGPRTAPEGLGRHLTFAPADDACTVCDHCGASAEEHGLPRRPAARTRPAVPKTAYFFGVWPGWTGGHFCHRPSGARATGEEGRPTPWASALGEPLCESKGISALLEASGAARREGVPVVEVIDGWTLLAMWDRSGDSRPGSVALFAFDAELAPAEAVAEARAGFPWVIARIEARIGRPVAP